MPAVTIPTTAAELEEMLANTTQVKSLVENNQLGDVIKAYAQASTTTDPGILAAVKEQAQVFMGEWLKNNPSDQARKLNLHAPSTSQSARNTLYNADAPGAAIDRAELFANHREFFAQTWHKARGAKSAEAQSKLESIRNDFGSSVPADGGFLIPETLRAELLRVALETAVVRPRARVIPMDSLTVPFPTIDSSSNASNVYGGVTAYWTEESAALTESQATFGRVKLEAKKLTAYAEVPNELFQDSIISFQAFVDQIFPEALAWFEDIAFLSGTGVGEPLGLLTAGNTASVAVSKETGQPADTILWENIVKMYARMLPTSLNRAVWIANINVFPELATMALSVGTGGSAVWLNNGAVGPPMTILGRPVIFTEKAATLGDAKDINFVDFSYYLVGDRQAMTSDTSAHYKFANDQTAIRFIERVDGVPWIRSAITPKTGSTTLSPFVGLAERA